MTNHPNRGKHHPARNPTPAEIVALRGALGLTQTDAARVIYCSLRTWQDWEGGQRQMHPAFWELFRRKTRVKATEAPKPPSEEEAPPKGE